MGKRKLTKADYEARAEMVRNAERTRQLAEKALADLERKAGHAIRPEGLSNAEWLRQLAEEGQARLDRRGQRGA